MRVTLPSTPGSHVDHNPFPTDPIFLQGFEDGVSTGPCSSLNQQVLVNRCVVLPDTHLNCVSPQNLLCCSTNKCLLFTGVLCQLLYPDLCLTSKRSLLLNQQVLVSRCVLVDTHLICVSLQIEVLPSLQRPKKITMNGSDGKLYTMLCKPKVGGGADNLDTWASSLGLKIKTCTVWDWYIVSDCIKRSGYKVTFNCKEK